MTGQPEGYPETPELDKLRAVTDRSATEVLMRWIEHKTYVMARRTDDELLVSKMAYNETRPYRCGGKQA